MRWGRGVARNAMGPFWLGSFNFWCMALFPPPDPTNILWENMEIPLGTRVRRELCSTVVVVGLVALSGILNALANSGSLAPGAAQVNAIDAAAGAAHVTLPGGISTLPQTLLVVVRASLLAFETRFLTTGRASLQVLNMIIQSTFEYLSLWEGHHHISGREEWLMVKMAVAQVGGGASRAVWVLVVCIRV